MSAAKNPNKVLFYYLSSKIEAPNLKSIIEIAAPSPRTNGLQSRESHFEEGQSTGSISPRWSLEGSKTSYTTWLQGLKRQWKKEGPEVREDVRT